MIRDRQLVYDKAEEMAAKYREQMRAKQQGSIPANAEAQVSEEITEEDIPAVEEDTLSG